MVFLCYYIIIQHFIHYTNTRVHIFICLAPLVLTSADNTSQFFLSIIWRAGQTVAEWFHEKKESCWISGSIKSWDRLRIFINTFCTTIMIVVSCHKVPNILHCPVSGTLCLGRNHHCHTSGGHIAHSTGNIVSTKRIERWKLSIDIFYSTNRTTSWPWYTNDFHFIQHFIHYTNNRVQF